MAGRCTHMGPIFLLESLVAFLKLVFPLHTFDVTVSVPDDIQNTVQHGSFRDPGAWGELMAVCIILYLRSKSHETRTAASVAVSNFSSTPVWHPLQDDEDSIMITDSSLPAPEFTNSYPYGGKKKARQEASGRSGFEFLDDVAEETDLDKELGADIESNAEDDMDIKAE
ncbi:hypothetical protein FB446DRAFT_827790 [Lentinula raphanica]|nr:hypothetical protein FB446DRAFT_827790 [Lentinula raphanica]